MKRHPIDLVSLTAGVLVVGTAVILMNPDADLQSLWQFAPLGLVALGLALLASAVTRVRGGATPAPASVGDASSRRADELTEEQLIRDSLGHFGADPADTDLLFGPAASQRTNPSDDETELSGDTEASGDSGDADETGDPDDTQRLSPPAESFPPRPAAGDDHR